MLSCRYEVGKKKGEYDEETLKREQAKNALERYMHYYQRYASVMAGMAHTSRLPNLTLHSKC